jgi:sterol desaturase/sphingolipid hydroxylase (fatty acid hydroxylase superfamily)
MWRTNFFRKLTQTRTDIWVALMRSPVLLLITQPFIMFVSSKLMGRVFPAEAGRLATIPIIAQVALLLVFDDMAQYWRHRASRAKEWPSFRASWGE